VDIVHTLPLGVPRTAFGLDRIPHVCATSQCFQGPECSSSPTLGTVFSQVGGFLVFFSCALCTHARL
jgi:hypothetical protein